MSEEKKGKGFVFVDKRKTGESENAEQKAGTEQTMVETAGEERKQPASDPSAKAKEDTAQPLPGIDFSSFVLSLSSSAMMHLGLLANPMTQQTEKNLPLAKQTIDIIAMLQKKTTGNLTDEESKFLEAILYDLRMNFVEISKQKK
jgi:hypothetical protein